MSRKAKIKRIDDLTNRILDRQLYVREIAVGVCDLRNTDPDEETCYFCTDDVHCFSPKSCKCLKPFI